MVGLGMEEDGFGVEEARRKLCNAKRAWGRVTNGEEGHVRDRPLGGC